MPFSTSSPSPVSRSVQHRHRLCCSDQRAGRSRAASEGRPSSSVRGMSSPPSAWHRTSYWHVNPGMHRRSDPATGDRCCGQPWQLQCKGRLNQLSNMESLGELPIRFMDGEYRLAFRYVWIWSAPSVARFKSSASWAKLLAAGGSSATQARLPSRRSRGRCGACLAVTARQFGFRRTHWVAKGFEIRNVTDDGMERGALLNTPPRPNLSARAIGPIGAPTFTDEKTSRAGDRGGLGARMPASSRPR